MKKFVGYGICLCLLWLVLFNENVVYCMPTAIDFSEDLKIAIYDPKSSTKILLNPESQRSTPAAIAIVDNERLFGTSAVHWVQKQPSKAFKQLRSIIGRKFNSTEVQTYMKSHPSVRLVESQDRRQTVEIQHPEFHEPFPIEELVGGMIYNLVDLASSFTGETISDVVIAVPPYFDQFMRCAILDVARIVGIKVSEIINDLTAAAFQYLLSLKDLDATPRFFIFCDFGFDVSSASIVSFSLRPTTNSAGANVSVPSLVVIATESVPGLGGLNVETALFNYAVENFFSAFPLIHREAFMSNSKSVARLYAEISKVIQTLTVNMEIELIVEALFEDTDLKLKVSRKQLEDLCTDVKASYMKLLNRLLEKSNFSKDNIEALVPIGGGSRPPFVHEVFKTFIGDNKIRHNLSVNEAVVYGGSFDAACLSKRLVVVKQMRVIDMYMLTSYISEDNKAFTTLFPYGSHFGDKKIITLKKVTDFEIYLYQEYPETNEKQLFCKVSVRKVAEALASITETLVGEPKVKISIGLSNSGIINVENAAVVYVYSESVPIPRPKLSETNNTASEAGSSHNETKVTETEFRLVNKTQRIELEVVEETSFTRMSDSQIEFCRRRSQELQNNYSQRRKKEGACNELESLAYELKHKLADPEYLKYMTPQTKDVISANIQVALKKLEDSSQYTADQYIQDHAMLETLVAPVEVCRKNQLKLPDSITSLRDSLTTAENLIAKIRKITCEDVTEEELQKLQKLITETSSWTEANLKEQQKLALSDPPVLTFKEVLKKKAIVDGEVSKLSAKFYTKKTKPEPKTKAKADKETDWAEKLTPDMRQKLSKMMEDLKSKDINLGDLESMMEDAKSMMKEPPTEKDQIPAVDTEKGEHMKEEESQPVKEVPEEDMIVDRLEL